MRWQYAKLAGAAEVAVAINHFFALNTPISHLSVLPIQCIFGERSIRHSSILLK
jgi:hypothetical protein